MRPAPRYLVLLLAVLTATCAEQVTGPGAPAVTTVEVTSNIGNRLAVGRTANLTAAARDAVGVAVAGATFIWSSSQPAIASVSTSGVVTGAANGATTITVTADGISATLGFQVSTPDFPGITATMADPLVVSLTGGLSTTVRTRTQTALNLCTSGIGTGDFSVVESCIAGVRAEALGAVDVNDMALLATIALFIDHIDRLLKL